MIFFHRKIIKEILIIFSHICYRHPAVKVGFCGHIGDLFLALDAYRLILVKNPTTIWLHKSCCHLHPGGFPTSVRTQHGIYKPCLQFQGYMIHSSFSSICFCCFSAFQNHFHILLIIILTVSSKPLWGCEYPLDSKNVQTFILQDAPVSFFIFQKGDSLIPRIPKLLHSLQKIPY